MKVLLFILVMVASITSYSQTAYFPVKVNDRWGMINVQGKIIIKPVWEYIPYEVSPGKFRVYDTLTASEIIIDHNNRFVDSITLEDEYNDPYSEKDGPGYIYEKGYINQYGNVIIKDTFEKSFPFENGLARVVTKGEYPEYSWDDNAGYIDRTGKFVIPPVYGEFDLDDYFQNGYIRFASGTYEGFLNTKGDTVIPPIYDQIRDFSEDMAAVNMDDKWNFINRKGELLLKEWFGDVEDFGDGMASVRNYDEHGLIHYVNKKGEVLTLDTLIFENVYSWGNDFKEGLAAATLQSGEDVYIDKSGKIVLKGPYYYAGDFSEGIAAVSDTSGVYFIDKTGRAITKERFSDADAFENGLAKVFTGNDVGGIATGCVVAGTSYRFHDHSLFKGDLKMGYINKQGVVVWKPTR